MILYNMINTALNLIKLYEIDKYGIMYYKRYSKLF